MPTTKPRKPAKTAKNELQPFRQVLTPTMPMAPSIEIAPIPRRGTLMSLTVIILAIVAGILAGLAIRTLTTDIVTVGPGSVAVVTNPQYARIAQAEAVALPATPTLQVAETATKLQPVNENLNLQGGIDLNRLQPVLSAYDAQGSVNGPGR